MSVDYSAVLIRYGEIGIKSRQTRKRMSRLLATRIASALRAHDISFSKIKTEYGRLFVSTADAQKAAHVASRVFGVVSTSPVVVTTATMASILEAGLNLARKSFRPQMSFAVGARRIGTHEFTSQDVRQKLGAIILKKLPDLHLTVDLKNPDQSVYVEVRDDIAYLFTDTTAGVGGMPTGSQGKVLCIIDGTLASLVAAYRVMKRGVIPVFVIFSDLESPPSEVHVVASYIYGMTINAYLIAQPDLFMTGHLSVDVNLCTRCRQNMIDVASELAELEDADAIVTGDIIGDSGRTTHALKVIRSVRCEYPIFQPCAGDDPDEIVRSSHTIGIDTLPSFGCSDCPSALSLQTSNVPPSTHVKEIVLPSAKEQIKNSTKFVLKKRHNMDGFQLSEAFNSPLS